MDKKQLKLVLKPLIKECIKEMLFEEEGVLSTVIAEVVKATSSTVSLVKEENNKQLVENKRLEEEKRSKKLLETRKRMAAAMSNDAYAGVFENTKPLRSGGTTSPTSSPEASNPLSAYAPEDSGVNIDGLLSVVGNKWGKLRG